MTAVKKSTRIIAAKLLDDMCANMELIKPFDDNDIGEVAHSLQELLDDVGAVILVEEDKSLDIERLLLSKCKCVEIMQADETRHFRGCPLRVDTIHAEPADDAWKTQDDQPLPEDAEIEAAFPTRSGKHDVYAEAQRMVSARYSKFGLIALVNMLLHRVAKARGGW